MQNVPVEHDFTEENKRSVGLVHRRLVEVLDIKSNTQDSQLNLTGPHLTESSTNNQFEEDGRVFWSKWYRDARDYFSEALNYAGEELDEVQNFIKQAKKNAKPQGSKKSKTANFGDGHPSVSQAWGISESESPTIAHTITESGTIHCGFEGDDNSYGGIPRRQSDYMQSPSGTAVVATSKEDLRNLSAWCDARKKELKTAYKFLEYADRSAHFSPYQLKTFQKVNPQDLALLANIMYVMSDLISEGDTATERLTNPSGQYRKNHDQSSAASTFNFWVN